MANNHLPPQDDDFKEEDEQAAAHRRLRDQLREELRQELLQERQQEEEELQEDERLHQQTTASLRNQGIRAQEQAFLLRQGHQNRQQSVQQMSLTERCIQQDPPHLKIRADDVGMEDFDYSKAPVPTILKLNGESNLNDWIEAVRSCF